jgi:Osmosensitive K+ channel histidine kinase
MYSVSIVLLITAVCYLFSGFLGYKTVAFILLVTVSLIAITFDILPVLMAAVLSAFLWNFFFIPPRFTFHVDSSEDTILFFMYFIIAMINAY